MMLPMTDMATLNMMNPKAKITAHFAASFRFLIFQPSPMAKQQKRRKNSALISRIVGLNAIRNDERLMSQQAPCRNAKNNAHLPRRWVFEALLNLFPLTSSGCDSSIFNRPFLASKCLRIVTGEDFISADALAERAFLRSDGLGDSISFFSGVGAAKAKLSFSCVTFFVAVAALVS